jgi:hypothetical protein
MGTWWIIVLRPFNPPHLEGPWSTPAKAREAKATAKKIIKGASFIIVRSIPG